MRIFVGCLFRLTQFLVMVMSSIGVWRICYAVDEDYVRDTVLVYGYGTSLYFQDAIQSECSSLKFVSLVACQDVCE